MSSSLLYTCPCFNIKLHLSSKYNSTNIEQYKVERSVQQPFSGWELELDLEGINTEFPFLTRCSQEQSEWKTVDCLNCNTNQVYSIAKDHSESADRVVIHPNAVCSTALQPKANSVFGVNLDKSQASIPMPTSMQDIPDNFAPAYKQIQSVMDQAIEQLRIESQVRIENFKREEERRLQESISEAQLENNALWTKFVTVSKEQDEPKAEDTPASYEKSTFKQSISSLKKTSVEEPEDLIEQNVEVRDEEEEEDMFNLDEELVDIDDKPNIDITIAKEEDVLLPASLKKSIDQRFSWIKKKKKTSKYLVNDFDIKSDLPRTTADENENYISVYATSMPITIQYHVPEEEEEEKAGTETDENNKPIKPDSPKKRELLVTSFANYDFSFSDRLLSEQFADIQETKREEAAS